MTEITTDRHDPDPGLTPSPESARSAVPGRDGSLFPVPPVALDEGFPCERCYAWHRTYEEVEECEAACRVAS